jgi:hypothetical protein
VSVAIEPAVTTAAMAMSTMIPMIGLQVGVS